MKTADEIFIEESTKELIKLFYLQLKNGVKNKKIKEDITISISIVESFFINMLAPIIEVLSPEEIIEVTNYHFKNLYLLSNKYITKNNQDISKNKIIN